MATPSFLQTHRANAVTLLLSRYLAGEIADAQFDSVSTLLDDTNVSADERDAFARFVLDALSADGDVELPRTEEVAEFLIIARA